MRAHGLLLVVTLQSAIFAMENCAGGRATIRFEKLEYPVSTSAYVTAGNQSIVRDERTPVKAEFAISQRFWGILYSIVSLSDGDDLVRRMNDEIRRSGGAAVTNLKIESEACAINSVIILSILPVFPGCTIVTIKGEIVGKK